MGMGLVGAGGAAGAAAAMRQIREELLKRAILAQQQKQQGFENALALKGSARQDRQLDATLENTRLARETQAANQQAMQEDRQIGRALSMREMLPPETFLPESDPAVGLMEKAGLGGTLRMMPPTQPMGPDFQGPMPDGETTQQAQVGRMAGRLTMPTPRQAATAEDDQRQRAALEGQQATQAGLMDIRQQMADIARQRADGGGVPSPDAGWQLKEVTDPTTNQTRMVRVNSRTGEVQPVQLPDGVQPGGSRQTRLAVSQQEDLATMKTVEDLAKLTVEVGTKTGWNGIGGMYQGTIKQAGMKQLGTGAKDDEVLRDYISNIQGTIAKLRGGTSFTPNEQRLLDSYTPTINESPESVQAKIESLMTFIRLKRENMIQFAGGGMTATPDAAAKPQGEEYDFVPGRGLVKRDR